MAAAQAQTKKRRSATSLRDPLMGELGSPSSSGLSPTSSGGAPPLEGVEGVPSPPDGGGSPQGTSGELGEFETSG
eukprot:1666867-Pyramimonas_sp.AAC.1